MGDTISGTVGDESATSAIGKDILQNAAYGGSVFVVGRNGQREEMANSDYVILLLEQVNQRVSRVEQLSLQAATEQGSNRAELIALKNDLDGIKQDIKLLKEERQRERERLPLGMNQQQYRMLIRVVIFISVLLLGIFFIGIVHELNILLGEP